MSFLDPILINIYVCVGGEDAGREVVFLHTNKQFSDTSQVSTIKLSLTHF